MTGSARPDFYVTQPCELYIEVSTVNISQCDSKKIQQENSIALDNDETIRRVFGKFTEDKLKQLSYASNKNRPGVIVLFDYTYWSGFGTQFCQQLERVLLGQTCGFRSLPIELSALIYVDRHLVNGRFAIHRFRSAIYYNPYAGIPLAPSFLDALVQFQTPLVPILPDRQKGEWIYLC